MDRPVRPVRSRLPDFAGRLRTLPDDIHAWACLANLEKPQALLLAGGGILPPKALSFVAAAEKEGLPIHVLDGPGQPTQPLPPQWHRIEKDAALALAQKAAVWFYKPALALDPDFWSAFLARLEISLVKPPTLKKKLVWLPGDEKALLHRELAKALRERGAETIVEETPAGSDLISLRKLWGGALPALALSVNFRGLDAEGRIFELCRELGVPLLVWLVDNPWNLLSGIPLPWWRQASLFCTDISLCKSLREAGAENVFHCPLACAEHMWREPGNGSQPPLFVGRAAFPGRDSFFKGLSLPLDLLREAESLPVNLPDWHWWHEKLGIAPWPGLEGRKISFGADLFSGRKRSAWIGEGLRHGLEIRGDESWRELLPQARIKPPVDYYGSLPDLYQNALATLNVTSLLLPQSLSQRHFDVWAAGGFLLSDATKGLEIFPRELVEPIVVREPAMLGEKIAWIAANPEKTAQLRQAWRQELQNGHLYSHRLAYMLQTVGAEL